MFTYTGSRAASSMTSSLTRAALPPPPPKKTPIPTRDKIPVPEPLPPPMLVSEPSPGVPLWAWLAGGVVVVGGVAFLATRKKAA